MLGEVAVVLDGAGIPQRFRAGCRHSVAWYSHALAGGLLVAAQDPGTPLRAALAAAITEVRSLHEHECDLGAGSPSSTVLAVRATPDRLEHLVLSDSSLLLVGRGGAVERISDVRNEHVARSVSTPQEVEALRNAPGGFWVARHEPEAAEHAVVGSTALAGLARAHLVSDGITRLVELLALHDDASLATALERDPQAVIGELRAAERALPPARRPRKIHDDATVLTLRSAS